MNPIKTDSVYMCKHPVLIRTGCAVNSYQTWITKEDGTRSLQYADKAFCLLPVRCGKCEGCRKYQQDAWFCRLRHEALWNNSKLGSAIGFLTLTFNKENMDEALKLVVDKDGKKDYTEIYRRYIVPLKKRLRAERGENLKFKYYCTNEFGEQFGRFHFHLIMYFENLNNSLYQSERDDFCNKHCDFRHYVKTYVNNVPSMRPQTNDEMFLQCKILRQWTDENSRFIDLDDRLYNETHKVYKHAKSYEVTSTHSKGEIGHVTFFITQNVGMVKYVTNYSLKCYKDGITTYHRQSPSLGLDYVKNDDEMLNHIRDLKGVCPCGTWHGIALVVPIPRYYFRKLGNKDDMIVNFWEQYSKIISNWSEKHLHEYKEKLSLQRQMAEIDGDDHFYDTEHFDMPDWCFPEDMPLYMCV